MQGIGPYTLVGEIARGGMGAVYRARDPAGRDVALKLLVGQRAHSPQAQRRFATEVETHSRLRHPNVTPDPRLRRPRGVPYAPALIGLDRHSEARRQLDAELDDAPLSLRRGAAALRVSRREPP